MSGFKLNLQDMKFVLNQIRIAEAHAGGTAITDIWVDAKGVVVPAGTAGATLAVPTVMSPYGLRTVDGSYNNLVPGREFWGAADQAMPRLLTSSFRNDADGDSMPLGPPGSGAPTITNTNYNGTGSVADADPRIISNLIADMTLTNPAAVQSWLDNPLSQAKWIEQHGEHAIQLFPGDAMVPNGVYVTNADIAYNPNISPDDGISVSFNAWMTFFGQFFDHGLDLISKGGNVGKVYIPLQADDPLITVGPDGIANTGDEVPPGQQFMVLTRSTLAPGGGHEAVNTTTPFVDQNQTYTSHASHQVFLREYVMEGGKPHATGHLLDGANNGLPTWADIKTQALMLGIQLTDGDALNIPLLRTDQYGKFIPHATTGMAQLVVGLGADGIPNTADDIVVSGTPASPVNTFTAGGSGALRIGHAFLDDIADGAIPVFNTAGALVPDADTLTGNNQPRNAQGNKLSYDNELLDRHFVTGDGRGNENIGLTTVHHVFHSEHNRQVEQQKLTAILGGDVAFLNEWLDTNITQGQLNNALAFANTQAQPLLALTTFANTLNWDGERLFQAGRFATEMQYQHLVFEEFARKIQPAIDPFVFNSQPDINPTIFAEFAHVVYRFGHSMLTDNMPRIDGNGNVFDSDISLVEAFTNPISYDHLNDGIAGNDLTADEAAASVVRGMTIETGNAIDEFIVDSLRNNLLGLPLDLAALNIARGREAGVPTLNETRTQLYASTGSSFLKPYDNWVDVAANLKNTLSVVNFIAAYGKHPSINPNGTLEQKRDAAMALVFGTGANVPADRVQFLTGTGAWAGVQTGINDIDLWIGGLAEKFLPFGGMLGSTFNAIFELQLENLQDGDRFYYLTRNQGQNLLVSLEQNSFIKMIMANTDLAQPGPDGIRGTEDDIINRHVGVDSFGKYDYVLEVDESNQVDYSAATPGQLSAANAAVAAAQADANAATAASNTADAALAAANAALVAAVAADTTDAAALQAAATAAAATAAALTTTAEFNALLAAVTAAGATDAAALQAAANAAVALANATDAAALQAAANQAAANDAAAVVAQALAAATNAGALQIAATAAAAADAAAAAAQTLAAATNAAALQAAANQAVADDAAAVAAQVLADASDAAALQADADAAAADDQAALDAVAAAAAAEQAEADALVVLNDAQAALDALQGVGTVEEIDAATAARDLASSAHDAAVVASNDADAAVVTAQALADATDAAVRQALADLAVADDAAAAAAQTLADATDAAVLQAAATQAAADDAAAVAAQATADATDAAALQAAANQAAADDTAAGAATLLAALTDAAALQAAANQAAADDAAAVAAVAAAAAATAADAGIGVAAAAYVAAVAADQAADAAAAAAATAAANAVAQDAAVTAASVALAAASASAANAATAEAAALAALATAQDELNTLITEGSAPGRDPLSDNPVLAALGVGKVTRDDVGTAGPDARYLRFYGGEHVVVGGTQFNDTIITDDGDDGIWGDDGDDRIESGAGVDLVNGGGGNDIITDSGDSFDFIKGDEGDDVIANSNGIDILMGGSGKDVVFVGVDDTEVFAGQGDDFVLGGAGVDLLMGNEGDDWIEGGPGFDTIAGDMSELNFDSKIIGHDVMFAGSEEQDFDGESGDDIMVMGESVIRNEGMMGFDWVIYKGVPVGADADMGIPIFTNEQADILRDRFDKVEALSGWNYDDRLVGDDRTFDPNANVAGNINANGEGVFFRDEINQAGIDRIAGLNQVITNDLMSTGVYGSDWSDTVQRIFTGGNVLLGGAGDDVIIGKGGNDIIDGDRWLNVRIRITAPGADNTAANQIATIDSLQHMFTAQQATAAGQPSWAGKTLFQLMIDRVIVPNQLHIVREVLNGGQPGDIDTAVFWDQIQNYTLTRGANGTITVSHTGFAQGNVLPTTGFTTFRPVSDDTDTLRNIEVVRFGDGAGGFIDYAINQLFASPATGQAIISDTTPTEGQTLTVDTSTIADLNGLGTFLYQWQRSATGTGNWTNIGAATTSSSFVVPDAPGTALSVVADQFLRVRVIFTDGRGDNEVIDSAATVRPVGANYSAAGSNNQVNFTGTAGDNIIIGSNFNDTLNGAAGDDVISGGNGNDTIRGNDGNDVLNGQVGNDTLNGDVGDDVISGGDGTDTLNGQAGNDILNGDAGNDTINGNAGNDVMTGGAGNDTLNGGTEIDIAVYAGPVTNYVIGGTTGTQTVTDIVGTEGADSLTAVEILRIGGTDYTVQLGTGGANTLNGGAGSQAIFGFGGVDTLNGGAGSDILNGGVGNDTINGDGGDDFIFQTSTEGRDLIDGGAGTDTYILSGVAGAETFRIYTRDAAIAAGINNIAGNTEIVITRNGTNNGSIIAQLDNIEEIKVNTLVSTANNGNNALAPDGGTTDGDTVQVIGDFRTTSLNYSTIHVTGSGANDTVDISGLVSDHRIVFDANGGSDNFIGGVRSQDVVTGIPGLTASNLTGGAESDFELMQLVSQSSAQTAGAVTQADLGVESALEFFGGLAGLSNTLTGASVVDNKVMSDYLLHH